MPFLVAPLDSQGAGAQAPVRCQACNVQKLDGSSDLDPATSKFWVELKWGRNLVKQAGLVNSAGLEIPTFNEDMITGYEIHIVNTKGAYVAMATTERVPAKKWSTDCCTSDAYSISIQGNWPAGGYAFMIVAYQEIGSGATMERFTMPIGTITDPFVDNTAGTARVVIGSVVLKNMSQADAVEFATHPDSKAIMRKSIAAADKEKKITEKNVIITKLTAKEATATVRRLGKSRRLEGTWTVQADYEVLLAADSSQTIDENWLNTTALTDSVNTESTKAGMDITVGGADVLTPTVDTITGEDALVTGAASSVARLLLPLALAVFCAGRH